jgi:hypothetical protein
MSKTIDTLKKASFKEDVLRNHIADTYFYQKPRPKTQVKSQQKKTNKLPNIRHIARTAVKISAIAVSLALVIVMSVAASSYIEKKNIEGIKSRLSGMDTISISAGGALNRDIIRRCEFRGLAKNRQSLISRSEIIMSSPEKYKWADMAFAFRFPVDLSKKILHLSLRGEVGGEKVSIVLRDSHNRSARINDLSVSSRWSSKSLRMSPIGSDIDISSIDHMRIESCYVGESSKDDDNKVPLKIYVKDISISREI